LNCQPALRIPYSADEINLTPNYLPNRLAR
jgi:hypothetical protein